MVFFIIVGSISFSRILATSGAITELANIVVSMQIHPIMIVIATQIILIFLGCFMDCSSIIMITAPLFFPIIGALGYDQLWYAVLCLINIQLGMITPPFGLDMFTMKAIAPSDVTMGDVFKSSMPFLYMGFSMMALIMIFPVIATWLPSVMSKG
jgi:TRAP-type C4-dicarboxylate transport system permease large subunit